MRRGDDQYRLERIGEAIMVGLFWFGIIGFLVFVVLGIVGNLFIN